MDTNNVRTADPVGNILAVYNGTDPRLPIRSAREHATLRANGVRWYRDNRRMIRKVAADTGLSRSTVAGVFAAYSINATWRANCTMAERAISAWLNGQSIRGMDNVIRLATIAFESNGDRMIESLRPTARKVRAFYGAFMGRSSVRPVIDRHANDIATGNKRVPNGKQYELVASYYVEAARIIGIRPEELQAATWTIWRGTGA